MLELKPPIVGRDEELETLMSSLGDAISGSGALVLIAGEVGIEKPVRRRSSKRWLL